MQIAQPMNPLTGGAVPQRTRAAIASVVLQHVEDAGALRNTRSYLVRAPHVRLMHLGRLDARIGAHLDGIAVAGRLGAQLSMEALEHAGRGELFTAAVGCIEARSVAGLDRLIALAEVLPEIEPGLHSAFGWVSATHLREIVNAQLESDVAIAHRTGIAACALHRVDPGKVLETAIASPLPAVHARALRCAGEIGRRDLLPRCLVYLQDNDTECRFGAARAAVLLGNRDEALTVMAGLALQPGSCRTAAVALAVGAGGPGARALLERLAEQATDIRALVRAVAHSGDCQYVPWLIRLMTDDKLARLAGEAFSFITGADLAWLDLDRRPPEQVPAGPNDNPDDPDTAMDEDEGAPWPDAEKTAGWWSANASHFRPGERYFVGAPLSWEHCLHVLKDGYQRQRIAAAHYLCLLRPGTVLFNCAAPAWRQLRRLGQMA